MSLRITKSEDCLIFYSLTPEVTKIKQVYSSFDTFMKNKQSKDPSDRFNLIAFEKDGPFYLEDFTFDSDLILQNLKSMSKDFGRANIAGGIFIAITFIIEVYKKISEKTFRLLIVIDDGAFKIPSHYMTALEELIKKVKDMPFFIDIVYIGKQSFEESSKLLKLVNLSKGEFHEIKNTKELNDVLINLSDKKFITIPSFVAQRIRMIVKDNRPFFINLADDPEVVNEVITCSICFQKDDKGIVRCPSCDTVAHKVCWAQWAKSSSIGIPYIYRCHNCFNILKLEENFVIDVQTGKIPTIAELNKVEKKNIVEYLKEIEAERKPEVVHTDDPFAADMRALMEARKTEPQAAAEEGKKKKKRRKSSVQICPNCSKIIMGSKKSCPTCGYNLF